MKKLLSISAASLLVLGTSAFAQSMQSLDKNQVTNAISDKTISMPMATLNNQMLSNQFTGFFDKNNTVKGHFASKPDNDVQSDEGTWTVKPNGTLCVTWQHWNATKPICVMVYKLKNAYVLVNVDNHNLETFLLLDDIKSGNQLS